MAKKQKKAKRSKFSDSYLDGWGIIGPYGNVWSPKIYANKRAAEQAVIDFWSRTNIKPKFSGPQSYKIVWMRQRAKPIKHPASKER